jgi:hypothetical protein
LGSVAEQGDLAEPQLVDGLPVVGLRGRAEHRQRYVVAGAVTHLAMRFFECLHRERIGNPSGVVPDHTPDCGVGIPADVDGRIRLLHGLGPDVGRVEVDVAAVVLGGFVGPQRLDGLDSLVEQAAAGFRVRAVVSEFLDVPACADPEDETAHLR